MMNNIWKTLLSGLLSICFLIIPSTHDRAFAAFNLTKYLVVPDYVGQKIIIQVLYPRSMTYSILVHNCNPNSIAYNANDISNSSSKRFEGLWINDQGFPLTNTTCGATDPSPGVGRVIVYSPSNLTNPANLNLSPKRISRVSSRPGFGGIDVFSSPIPFNP